MAQRPVFYVSDKFPYVVEKSVEFEYHSGFAISQKQKSIESLHNSFNRLYPEKKILEVSRRSSTDMGPRLSAFNLRYPMGTGERIPVECVFQSSKVFRNGNHYPQLIHALPGDAKSFISEKADENGALDHFLLEERVYPLQPVTSFYDWIYLTALNEDRKLCQELLGGGYAAFTDIEFNPQKSINCQAKTVALFISLSSRGILEESLSDYDTFCNNAYPKKKTLFDF